MKFSSYSVSQSQEIKDIFVKTFSDSEGETEGTLIGDFVVALMEETAPQDLYGFVAEEAGALIGGIFFSRLVFENGVNAFILSPVAVATQHQGQGVGQRLLRYGITQLKEAGVELLFTYGDPDYYSKVGFKYIPEMLIKAPLKLTYPDGWLAQSLVGDEIPAIAGASRCVQALNKPELW